MRVTSIRHFAKDFDVVVWGYGTAVEIQLDEFPVAYLQGDEAVALLDELDNADKPELILDQYVPVLMTEDEYRDWDGMAQDYWDSRNDGPVD